jgi:hypothetical protein
MISGMGRTRAPPSGMSSQTTSVDFQRSRNLTGMVVCPLLETLVFTMKVILYPIGPVVKPIFPRRKSQARIHHRDTKAQRKPVLGELSNRTAKKRERARMSPSVPSGSSVVKHFRMSDDGFTGGRRGRGGWSECFPYKIPSGEGWPKAGVCSSILFVLRVFSRAFVVQKSLPPTHRGTKKIRRTNHEGHRGHGGSLEGELSVLRALSSEPSGTWRGEPVPTVRRLFYRRPRRKRRRVLRRVCFVSSCLRGSKILLLLPLPIRAIRVIRGKTIPTVRRWFYRSRGRRGCFATKEHMERKGAPSL